MRRLARADRKDGAPEKVEGAGSGGSEAPLCARRGWATGRGFPLLHRVFQIGLVLKGFNALVELASGSVLLVFSVGKLRTLVDSVAGGLGSPWLRRHWASLFYRIGQGIAPDTRTFFTWFLLSHGAVKVFIIVCLLRGWIWAYPLGIAVFAAFIAYQIAQIAAAHHSALFVVLTVLDCLVIYLTANEWRHARLTAPVRGGRREGSPGAPD
ncbi:MAG: DUF2127 domain-containing protein [Treponema sp.]|nr:DUF2127 domain-containing protein [Treponema sp.]